MPITPTFPGVYIEELSSGVHTITGVATSITAFIGSAARGQVNEPTVVNSFSDFERAFGGLSLLSPMSFSVRDFFLNGGSQAVIIRLTNGGSPAVIDLPADTSPPGGSSPLASAFGSLTLEAANGGTWGNQLDVLVDHKTKNANDITLFNLTINLNDAARKQVVATERFLNLSLDKTNTRYVSTILKLSSSFVRVQTDSAGNDKVPGVRPADTFVTVLSPPGLEPSPVPGINGSDGAPLTQAQFTGPGTNGSKKGLYALDAVDLFNLLVIPPYKSDDVDASLVAEAAAYCEKRRAFYIVDPPTSWTNKAEAVKQFSNSGVGTASNYAAVFFPRVDEANPLRENQIETFAPSGAVAGIFSRTDAQRGVWKAPAGQETTLTGVSKLSIPLNDPENGELNPLGVNCLRTFPFVGTVVWGARTLEGADALASEWKYIPVRRTALFIEESLFRGTKWVVFEPNDEPLWAQIRLNVGAFMQNLFRQGAFQGKTPKEAYLVKCDSETTTQNDIDRGIVNILVGFAPLKPAEFVIIQIQQLAGQIQV